METEVACAEVAKESIEKANVGGVSPATFRNLVKQVANIEITSQQASNFLDIFGEDLEAELNATRRRFVEKHFGKRS